MNTKIVLCALITTMIVQGMHRSDNTKNSNHNNDDQTDVLVIPLTDSNDSEIYDNPDDARELVALAKNAPEGMLRSHKIIESFDPESPAVFETIVKKNCGIFLPEVRKMTEQNQQNTKLIAQQNKKLSKGIQTATQLCDEVKDAHKCLKEIPGVQNEIKKSIKLLKSMIAADSEILQNQFQKCEENFISCKSNTDLRFNKIAQELLRMQKQNQDIKEECRTLQSMLQNNTNRTEHIYENTCNRWKDRFLTAGTTAIALGVLLWLFGSSNHSAAINDSLQETL